VPVIHSIHPQIGNIGEPLTIRGANFGRERDVSYVTIAGAQPTGTSYLDWQDNEIIIRIPEFSEAGLVYAHVKGKKSNGILYANHATLPVKTVENSGGQGSPRIASITPQTGTIGTLISINGTGFGNTRGKGGVFFSWDAKKPVSAPPEAMIQEYIEASQSDFGVELWTEREIRVNVPDGAVSGNIEIRTAKGNSLPMSIDLSNRAGEKNFLDKRNYIASVSVSVKTGATEIPNTLYLWVPRPAVSAAQRNAELLSGNMEPFIENYKGTSLFKLENITGETSLNLKWKVEVYGIETLIRSQSIRQEANSPARDAFTRSEALLPADNPVIKSQVNALVGREPNPYIKAQKIYEWMLRDFTFQPPDAKRDIFTALEKKQADSYTAAMLYCTLLRCAGIPCLPIAGVLVSRDQQTMNHWWVEFWIDGFGWVPVDLVMGAGAIPVQFGDVPNKAVYYFGSIDSRRIAFSRGTPNLTQMDPRGRTVTHNRSYSLQNLWEEAVGGLNSYTSLWGDVVITGMYAQ